MSVFKLYRDMPLWLAHPEHVSGRVEIGYGSRLWGSVVIRINYLHRTVELADGRRFSAPDVNARLDLGRCFR